MQRDFNILLDMGDKKLAEFAVKAAFSLESYGRLCVVEARLGEGELAYPARFGLAVFDESSPDVSRLEALGRRLEKSCAPLALLHVGGAPGGSFGPNVICMNMVLFKECFDQLVGFCYITHLVRGAIADTRDLLRR